MEALAAIVTVTSLINGVAKIATTVANIKEKWQYAALNISMVSSSLWAVKAALEEIAEWRAVSNDKSQKSEQLDTNLEVCMESCAVLVAVIENRLKDVDLENVSRWDKARFVTLDELFKGFSLNLADQTRALQLLLTIYQCRTLAEQNERLQRTQTRRAVRAVRESTASLAYEEKDIEDAASILSEAPTTSFAFDSIIMQHQSYSKTYPKLYLRLMQNYPSRRASVLSASNSESQRAKRRLPPTEDPIITNNISLPFLGVPFEGENSHNESLEESDEDPPIVKPVYSRTELEAPIGRSPIEIQGSDTEIPEQQAKALIVESMKNAHETTGRESPVQNTKQGNPLLVEPHAAPGLSERIALKLKRRNRESFNSLYDDSDEESHRELPQEPQKEENMLSNNLHDTLVTGQTSDHHTPVTIPIKPIGPSVEDIETLPNQELKTTSIQPLPKETIHTRDLEPEKPAIMSLAAEVESTDSEHLQIEAEDEGTQNKNVATQSPPKSPAHSITKDPVKSILDINFGPDLDLEIIPRSPRTELLRASVEASSNSIHSTSSVALSTNTHVSTSPIKTTYNESEQQGNNESSALSNETFSPSESVEPNDLTGEPAALNSAASSTQLSERHEEDQVTEEAIVTGPDQPSPPPPPASNPPPVPLSPPANAFGQETTMETSDETQFTPIGRTYSQQHVNDVDAGYAGRSSFNSESSAALPIPCSPMSVQSHPAASSITSFGSSYTSRDHATYQTAGTTINSGPYQHTPRTITDPVQHEKKRLAITNSMAKLSQRAGTNKLTSLSSKLGFRGTAERNNKARILAETVAAGDATKLLTIVQSYEKASDISTCTIDGETALMQAARQDQVECAQVLMSHDPIGVAVVDKSGKTALHHSFAMEPAVTPLWLINKISTSPHADIQRKGMDRQKIIDIQDRSGVAAVHLASRLSDTSPIQALHAAHADFTVLDNKGWNALHCAALAGNYNALCYLIRQQLTNINARTSKGETALMLSSMAGDDISVAFLLEHGADKDLLDNDGNRALHHAARKGHLTVVETLFQSIEDVTATNYIGEQPLHFAALSDNTTEVLIALLRVPSIQVNCWTNPPHRKAVLDRSQGFEATRLLACTPLHYACASSNHQAADILLTRGALISNQEDGYSPLMMACQAQNSALVSLLLLQGADPKAATAVEGLTALHISCKVDDLASTRLLVQHGGDTTAQLKDKSKDTPSGRAYRENPETKREAATFAMRYRASVMRAVNRSSIPTTVAQPGAQVAYMVPSQYSQPGVPSSRQPYYPINDAPPPPYRY